METGNLNVFRDFLDINDLVFLTWKLMHKQESYGKIINICSGNPTNLREIVEFMIDYSGLKVKINENAIKTNLNTIRTIYGDNNLLNSLIGEFKFTSWKNSTIRIIKKLT